MPISSDDFKLMARGLLAQRRLGRNLRFATEKLDAVLGSVEFKDISDEEKFYIQQRFLGMAIEAEIHSP